MCQDIFTCAYAARGGFLEILKWARLNGYNWDYLTCAYAARNGHLEVLNWVVWPLAIKWL